MLIRSPELEPKIVKEYTFNDRTADQEILLRFADQEKAWAMDKVSNAAITEVTAITLLRSWGLTAALWRVRESSTNSRPQ